MEFEPILLKTSLRTILINRFLHTLWTSIIRYEFLIKIFAILQLFRFIRNIILLIFPKMLQRTLIIFTLTDMYKLFIRRNWSLLRILFNINCSWIHYCLINQTILREETYSFVSLYCFEICVFLLRRFQCWWRLWR